MSNARSIRIAIGTVCLIAVALVMGWFVGRYIPGEPRIPEPPVGEGLYTETGYETREVIDLDPGSTLQLRDITQGSLYEGRPSEVEQMPRELVNALEESGMWEYDCLDIDLKVREVKTISTKSFAEWHPDYAGTYRPVYDDSELIAVTVSITNASDSLITQWYKLPIGNARLWSEELAGIDDSLSAGAVLDDAFVFANENYGRDELLEIQPGESQEVVLPFKVNANNLKDPGAFDDLDPSAFCLQIVDYDTGTAYRLWL
ncbi:hypothetical protein [Arabiibacter massiliensis]|uniref:hypothetical protein n=1 Tax=Arabiibacter massiliensis TaxID=1870985 RepID=UPI0009BB0E0F|nr:hypothetical protein [Arabiibacter massiliensis]